MENISLLKERWFKKEVERLASKGVSKADIARALDIKPQYLNSVINGNRGLADTFLDKFIEAYGINQFDLLPHAEDSVMSLRLMDKIDAQEAKIDQLQSELRRKSEELATVKEKLFQYQQQKVKNSQPEADDLGGKTLAKSVSTKKHSSQDADNATSANVQ